MSKKQLLIQDFRDWRIWISSIACAAFIPMLLIFILIFDQFGFPDFESELYAAIEIATWLWVLFLISIWITLWLSKYFSNLKQAVPALGFAKGIIILLLTIGQDYSRNEFTRLYTLELSGEIWIWTEVFQFLLSEVQVAGLAAILFMATDIIFFSVSSRAFKLHHRTFN